MIVAAALLLAPFVPPTAQTAASWFAMNAATLQIGAPDAPQAVRCEFEFTPEGDVRVRVASTENGKPVRRELILAGGALVAREAPLPAGREMEVVDSCRLSLQLATTLLAYGVGVPPLSIRGRDEVAIVDAATPIHLTGTAVEADVPTPWSLHGWAESETTGVVSFDIVHTTAAGDARLAGRWEKRVTAPALPDEMPLAGWKVFRIDKGRAIPSKQTYRTLGALRAAAP